MGRTPWTKRLTVEDCPIHLSTTIFLRDRIFNYPLGTLWTCTWSLGTEHRYIGRLNFEITSGGRDGWAIFFPEQFLDFGSSFFGGGQTIPLVRTKPRLGGTRIWFLCECGRRSGRLYLPDGQPIFQCRLCYNLTYQSSQQHSHRQDALRAVFEDYREWSQRQMAERAQRQQLRLAADTRTQEDINLPKLFYKRA
jgi:hypothetical protein